MSDPLELNQGISRREFLRLSGINLLALGLPVHWARPELMAPRGLLGRVATQQVYVRRRPVTGSERVKGYSRDEVMPLGGAVFGESNRYGNSIWYRVRGLGYVRSSMIQPVWDRPNRPASAVPKKGMLVEVTVPYVDALVRPSTGARRAYRYYYASTHWVTRVQTDKKGQTWYRIRDDLTRAEYYAPAEALRVVEAEELTPISPDVPPKDKFIVVDLRKQLLNCFEGSRLVFCTRVSTGRKYGDGDFSTPVGSFWTNRKRPSRHMAVQNPTSSYDLPGVPWVSYITMRGVSIHGTYWHNGYGTPRSHGCINLTPQAAKWVFRWTTPVMPHGRQIYYERVGTRVRVRV